MQEQDSNSSDSKKKSSKKNKKIKSVGVGRGRFKWDIGEAGALATKDPSKLMSNLKIGDVKISENQLEMLQSILEQATSGTEEMSEVYTFLDSQPSYKDKEENKMETATIGVNLIPMRDAQKYIEHTVTGATNAFGINWDKDIEVTSEGGNVVVVLV